MAIRNWIDSMLLLIFDIINSRRNNRRGRHCKARIYDIFELVSTVSLFRDLLGDRFRKRMKDKGYRSLSVHSKEVREYGAKPGWVKAVVSTDKEFEDSRGIS